MKKNKKKKVKFIKEPIKLPEPQPMMDCAEVSRAESTNLKLFAVIKQIGCVLKVKEVGKVLDEGTLIITKTPSYFSAGAVIESEQYYTPGSYSHNRLTELLTLSEKHESIVSLLHHPDSVIRCIL